MNVANIFSEYDKKRKYIDVTIAEMKANLGEMINHIVLYGAGSAGIAFLHYLRNAGINPVYFSDGNPKRWGQICEDLEIIDYHHIVDIAGENALVIVTINTDGKKYCKSFNEELRQGGHDRVHNNLHEAGCKNVIDYTYFRRVRDLFKGDIYNLPSCSDVSCMLDHQSELEQVYKLLADDESKDVFLKIIRFRMIDDTISIPTRPQDKQYFEYSFFEKNDSEVFVDCGAYNGISLRTFISENKDFVAYYGFEPDKDNYEELEKYVSSLPEKMQNKMHLFKKAVYSHSKGARLYALNGPGSFISDIGLDDIDTVTIDGMLGNNRASFIKMNIEGSEISALQGAKKTIELWQPRLAIAGYHKTWDLWEVPLLIHSICEDYRFYLRSYMNHISFVYYGVCV